MRCYDGCPDKELQAIIDDCALARKQLADAGLTVTYFPMEGKWRVFRNYTATGGFHDTLRQAADAALKTT